MTTFTSVPVRELLHLRIRDGLRMLPVAAGMASQTAIELGFRQQDADRVQSVVALLCADIVESHFDDPSEADFTIVIGERGGSLIVRIEDQGLPYPVDHLHLEDGGLLGRQHAHGHAESIRFENRGLEGNLVELTVSRDPRHEEELGGNHPEDTSPVAGDAPITIRPLLPEDAPGLARCVYRCYGYSYASDFLYYPDQILAMIEQRLLRSYVGLSADGEVVGHSGLLRETESSLVAESGMGLVDPRYRHHHLLESLKAQQSQAVDELDLVGIYVDAVTVHPITQKVNAELGALETGILLAEIPSFTHFKGFEEKAGERGSVVVYYRSVGESREQTVYAPARYRELIDSIYTPLGLTRTHVALEDFHLSDVTDASNVHVEIKGRRGLGRIEVTRGGYDLEPVVEKLLRELCRKHLDVIHLDIPLGDPVAMASAEAFARMGFFFAAVIPELRGGDVFRLQYLNNIDADVESIVLYTDRAKELLSAIMQDRTDH